MAAAEAGGGAEGDACSAATVGHRLLGLMLGHCKALFHTKISEPDSSKQLKQVRMVLPGGAFQTQWGFLQGRAQQRPLHPLSGISHQFPRFAVEEPFGVFQGSLQPSPQKLAR